MDVPAPLFWFFILISFLLLAAAFAVAAWRLALVSTRPKKPAVSLPQTPPSDTALARVEADQAELFSTLQKLTTTVKRLSSRAGMQDVRERREEAEPPRGTSKADLLRHYGMSGKVGPDFARAQLERERSN